MPRRPLAADESDGGRSPVVLADGSSDSASIHVVVVPASMDVVRADSQHREVHMPIDVLEITERGHRADSTQALLASVDKWSSIARVAMSCPVGLAKDAEIDAICSELYQKKSRFVVCPLVPCALR